MPATVPLNIMNPWCPVSWSPQNKQPRTECSTKDATKKPSILTAKLALKQQRQQNLVLSCLLSKSSCLCTWLKKPKPKSHDLAARESRTHTFCLSSPPHYKRCIQNEMRQALGAKHTSSWQWVICHLESLSMFSSWGIPSYAVEVAADQYSP